VRRTWLVVVSALCLAAICSSARGADGVTLTAESDIRIVEQFPVEAAQGTLAPVLREYLLRCLGRKELAGRGAPVTFLIEAKALTWSALKPGEAAKLEDIDSFRIEVAAGPEGRVRISGLTVLGAGYGVMHFLDRYMGVKWVFPGDLGTVIPERARYELKSGVEARAPAFVSRTYTGMLYSPQDRMLAFRRSPAGPLLKNERPFFESYDYFRSLRLHLLTHASHNMFNIYPPKEYGEKLPEVFPLTGGKRFIPTGNNAWHPCYSNPKSVEIAIEKARKSFDGGNHCFSLGINDGLRVQCECPECARAGWPGAYFNYVRKVAEAVKDRYPPHLIGVLSYGDVKFPTPDLVLPENVLVLVTGGRLSAWQGHCSHVGTYEYCYGSGFWVPNFPLKAMKENAAAYRKMKAGVYHAEVHPVWAFDGPKVYIMARQLWEPELDVEACLREYCDAAFGAGGEAMARYYRRWAALRDNDKPVDGLTQVGSMHLWRRSSAQFRQMTPAAYEALAACLAEADGKVRPGPETLRLEMAQAFFDYSRNLFEMNRLPQEVFAGDVPEGWQALLSGLSGRIERRKEMLERFKAHPEWFQGTGADAESISGTGWEGHPGWSLNNDIHSAALTLLYNLGRAGRLGEVQELGADLKPYAVAARATPVAVSVRPTHGWYTEAKTVAVPAQAQGNAMTFKTARTDARIEEGADMGTFKRHYAMASFGLPPRADHKAYMVELTVTGAKGRLSATTLNFANGIGWSPVDVAEEFGEAPRAVTLRFIVEPVYPAREDYMKRGTSNDVHIIWSPADAESQVEGLCRISMIEYAAK
jgi:hypothetical protein